MTFAVWLRHWCALVFIWCSSWGSTPLAAEELARSFAICAGRFEALATRQSARQDPAAFDTRADYAEFALLMDAAAPLGTKEAVQWHAGGWVQVASLLARMDAGESAGTAGRLHTALETCRDLISF